MKISFLYGASLGTMTQLFVKHKGKISIRRMPSFLLHIFYGVINSIMGIPDLFFRKNKEPKSITFITGHYRSGTSHLLNLLTEEGTFTSPNNYQCLFPHSFLTFERLFTPLLNAIAPKTRPMDNMTMDMSSPQEEEIGIAALGGPTPILAVHFPKEAEYYKGLLSFKNASEKDVRKWKKRHKWFIRKLCRKYGTDCNLVLKSPANSARIPLLLEMYPDAKFIHIHRDPYKTILSSRHLFNVWYDMDHFQSLDELRKNLNENVADTFEEINRGWIDDSPLIPEDRKISISFQEVQKEPIVTMRKVYSHLGYTFNEEILSAYLETIKHYQKNKYQTLSSEDILEINERFDFVFREFGYEKKST